MVAKARALLGTIYGLLFIGCMTWVCIRNLEILFDLKRWSLGWAIGFLVFALGWGYLVRRVLTDGVSFEKWLIARVTGRSPHEIGAEPSGAWNIIAGWMPLVIPILSWVLSKPYGEETGDAVVYGLGLAALLFLAYRGQVLKAQIPAGAVYLLAFLIPTSLETDFQTKYGLSMAFWVRMISLLLGVIGLQFQKPFFLKLLGWTWSGQVLLFMLLLFCIGPNYAETLSGKKPDVDVPSIWMIYGAGLLVVAVLGFPMALKTAFVGTSRMGLVESFIAESFDFFKVAAGFVVLGVGIQCVGYPSNHTLLVIVPMVLLGLYYGDVLDQKAIEAANKID